MSEYEADFPLNTDDAGCGRQPAAGSASIPLLPTLNFPADPELVAQGWERRFTADPNRAREATALYTELGFDVRLEPIKSSELSDLCGDCRTATCLAYVTLYTRRKNQA